MSRYKWQARSMVLLSHLLGCETESKHILNRSKIVFANLINSRQSTPFNFPPWYAAADIPNSIRIFSKSASTGVSTFFFSPLVLSSLI